MLVGGREEEMVGRWTSVQAGGQEGAGVFGLGDSQGSNGCSEAGGGLSGQGDVWLKCFRKWPGNLGSGVKVGELDSGGDAGLEMLGGEG